MRRSILLAAAVVLVSASCGDDGGSSASSTTAGDGSPTTTTAAATADEAHYGGHVSDIYEDPAVWLCRPDIDDDVCDGDLDATEVAADGTLTPDPFVADPDAPIDCFYVYPTISSDATPNSDLVPGQEEEGTVRNQVARLGSACRVFAPVYRQVTLGALMGAVNGEADDGAAAPDRDLAYEDVLDAWKHYIDNDNEGRGVVLVGHSQGSGVLNRLIAEEIDDDEALRERLVAAYLLGSGVRVPIGEDVGGDFANVPACRSNDQTGCVVSYASFRSTSPPPEGSFFGRPRSPEDGEEAEGGVLCTNPAALGGGSAEMHGYYRASAAMGFADPERNAEITTPFVAVPGLVQAECIDRDGFSYLEVTVTGDPTDPRTDDIGGDFLPGWGLHIIDANIAMGDIVTLVGDQADAWLAER